MTTSTNRARLDATAVVGAVTARYRWGDLVRAGSVAGLLISGLHPGERTFRWVLLIALLLAQRRVTPPAWDLVCSVTLFVATVIGIPQEHHIGVRGCLVMHLVTPGVVALTIARSLGTRLTVTSTLPPLGVSLVRVGALGLLGTALATVWELYEWWARGVFGPGSLYGTYGDTLRDLASGAAGAFVLAALETFRSRTTRRP